jgi:fluoroquinolone resistance protein
MNSEISSNKQFECQLFNSLNLGLIQFEQVEFIECEFSNCFFVETIFINSTFIRCRFENCDLSMIKIPGCTFSGIQFQSSKLLGIDWTKAQWGASLIEDPFVFDGCVLNYSTFIGLDIKGTQFRNCTCLNVDFREADLSDAVFNGSDLTDSLFSQTNLSKADLSRARNYNLNPQENNIDGAIFSLPEAMSLIYNLDINLIEI